MALVHYQDPERKTQTPVSADNPLPVTMSGGGGGGQVEVTNFPATQAVTGPLTQAQFTAVAGTAPIAAWSGTGDGTQIGILKAMYAQNEQMIALLTDIRDNTAVE